MSTLVFMKARIIKSPEMEKYKPHPGTKAAPGVHEKLLGTIGAYKVWIVDGTIVRDNLYIDFVQGGNPGRYRFIPENELWLEKEFRAEDTYATMIHEYVECFYMRQMGMSYSMAHDEAADIEKKFRDAVSEKKAIASLKGAIEFLKTNFGREKNAVRNQASE